MEKIKLILGDGLLGSELHKITNWNYISRKKDNLDIDKYFYHLLDGYDIIINCIAHTKTRDTLKEEHKRVNIDFVKGLIRYCNNEGKKLVHISTDYVYTYTDKLAQEDDILSPPRTWYGYSKMIGDILVQEFSQDYLIIRETHKPNPYPHSYAWHDLVGNFDYVDKIAPIIVDLIHGNAEGIYNVGTETKTLYELAKRTNSNVKIDLSIGNTIDRPKDTTMDLRKLKMFYKNLK